MTLEATIPPITGTVTVDLSIERAFALFTETFNKWWPPQFHIGQVDMAEAVLECRAGGRWYERGVDGTECDWGRVLVWEPPQRLVVTWQINGDWQFDPDPHHASEVDVRFAADGADRTVIDVEHRLLERVIGGEVISTTIVQGGGGWIALLKSFAASLAPEG